MLLLLLSTLGQKTRTEEVYLYLMSTARPFLYFFSSGKKAKGQNAIHQGLIPLNNSCRSQNNSGCGKSRILAHPSHLLEEKVRSTCCGSKRNNPLLSLPTTAPVQEKVFLQMICLLKPASLGQSISSAALKLCLLTADKYAVHTHTPTHTPIYTCNHTNKPRSSSILIAKLLPVITF